MVVIEPESDSDEEVGEEEPKEAEEEEDLKAAAERGREALETSAKMKEVGIGAYTTGDFKKAIDIWSNALQYIADEDGKKKLFCGDNAETLTKEARQLEVVLHLNLAQAHLKNAEFHQSITFCDKVLANDTQNAKALYRKASAQVMGSDFEAARLTAQTLLEVDPENAGAKQIIVDIGHKEKAAKQATRKIGKKMFANLQHDPRTLLPPPKNKEAWEPSGEDDEDDDSWASWWMWLTAPPRALCNLCRRRKVDENIDEKKLQ